MVIFIVVYLETANINWNYLNTIIKSVPPEFLDYVLDACHMLAKDGSEQFVDIITLHICTILVILKNNTFNKVYQQNIYKHNIIIYKSSYLMNCDDIIL